MVLGNPHFPWAGAERLYQNHLTIPGKADVSGATLYGVPAVLIGHTRGLAWSHTVATAWRFTPFELKLVPGDPHAYLYDGQVRRMKETRVTVKALVNGKLEDRSRTLYETVHGPMFTSLLGLPLFPWTPDHGVRAGRREREQLPLPQPLRRDQPGPVGARSTTRSRSATRGSRGSTRSPPTESGEAYYSMNGAIPNLPDEKASQCQTTLGPVFRERPGPAGPRRLALGVQLGRQGGGRRRRGTASELAHPLPLPARLRAQRQRQPLARQPRGPARGFDRIVGIERAEVTPRTRLGLVMMRDRLAGRDGLPGRRFNLSILERWPWATASTSASCGGTASSGSAGRTRPSTAWT